MISSSRTGSALPARSAPLLRRHPAPCGTGAQIVLYFGSCIELRDRPKTLAHPQALPSARNDLSGRAAPLRRIRANSKLLLGEEFALEEERLRHHALGGVAGHRSLTRPEGSIVPECSRAESGSPKVLGRCCADFREFLTAEVPGTLLLGTWVNKAASRKFNSSSSLGGTCLLRRVLRLGDGAQLLHQSEQVKLDPVLLHLAAHHAVELHA